MDTVSVAPAMSFMHIQKTIQAATFVAAYDGLSMPA
jgi:hypothetical protein